MSSLIAAAVHPTHGRSDDTPAPQRARVTGARFNFFSRRQIARISAKRIVSQYAHNDLDERIYGGLADPSMGPVERREGPCQTCQLSYPQCSGHLAHVQLPVPVLHPLTFALMTKLLQATCFSCHRFKAGELAVRASNVKMALLRAGLWMQAQLVDETLHRIQHKSAVPKIDIGDPLGVMLDTNGAPPDQQVEKRKKPSATVEMETLQELDDALQSFVEMAHGASSSDQAVKHSPDHCDADDNLSVEGAYRVRQSVFEQVLDASRSMMKCRYCQAVSPKVQGRKKQTRVFVVPLTRKQIIKNESHNVPNIDPLRETGVSAVDLAVGGARGSPTKKRTKKGTASDDDGGDQDSLVSGEDDDDGESVERGLQKQRKGAAVEEGDEDELDSDIGSGDDIPVADYDNGFVSGTDSEREQKSDSDGGDDDGSDDDETGKKKKLVERRNVNDDDADGDDDDSAVSDDMDDDRQSSRKRKHKKSAGGMSAKAKKLSKRKGAETEEKPQKRWMLPTECEAHVRLLCENEGEFIVSVWPSLATEDGDDDVPDRVHDPLPAGMSRVRATADPFFVQMLVVPPPIFRPRQVDAASGRRTPHAHTYYLQQAIQSGQLFAEKYARIRSGGALDVDKNGDRSRRQSLNYEEAEDGHTRIRDVTSGRQMHHRVDMQGMLTDWIMMQDNINGLMDMELAQVAKAGAGIKQRIEKKKGLLRGNMMGKRVNFSGRSIISPDPFLSPDEIGVPMHFAMNLTLPVPVTHINVADLRRAIVNGAYSYPGANAVQHEDGRVELLAGMSAMKREELARTLLVSSNHNMTSGQDATKPSWKIAAASKCVSGPAVRGTKRVLRHMRDGDVVIMNRQPSLHRPSMMAHRARVIRYNESKTLRMHYANCEGYNADFDGDEMNLHFPQNQLASSEARDLLGTRAQYIVPTDGSPCRGLIQDHIVACVLLSTKDTFFNRSEFQQLVWATVNEAGCEPSNIVVPMVPPAVWCRGVGMRWTGKQLITAVIQFVTHGYAPLRFDGHTRLWGRQSAAVRETVNATLDWEKFVCIRAGTLLTGVIDKQQLGSASHGLVHACHELYGPVVAERLLGAIGRLGTLYLQRRHGFTCGISDMLLTREADQSRMESRRRSAEAGWTAAKSFVSENGSDGSGGGEDDEDGDAAMSCDDHHHIREELRRKLNDMSLSAAERDALLRDLDGTVQSSVAPITSAMMNTCLSNTSTPFPENCLVTMTKTGAKGSLINHCQISCCLDQQMLEGKRVPLMASGKTLPAFLPYDATPRAGGYVGDRFLTGIRPQEYYFHCMAGREGLVDTTVKTANVGYLQRMLIKHMEGLKVAYDETVRDGDGSVIQFRYGGDGVDVKNVSYLSDFEFYWKNLTAVKDKVLGAAATLGDVSDGDACNMRRGSGDLVKAASSVFQDALNKFVADKMSQLESDCAPVDSEVQARKRAKHGKRKKNHEAALDAAASAQLAHGKKELEGLQRLMGLNYVRSHIDPGEAVGILSAQSVGEPSTQMTLNTFHLAGHGGANVTLGIPRLREILCTTARAIKAPIMTLPVRIPDAAVGKAKEGSTKVAMQLAAEALAQRLRRVHLHEIVSDLSITERHLPAKFKRTYVVRLELLGGSRELLEQLSFKDMRVAIEEMFARDIHRRVLKTFDKGARKALDETAAQKRVARKKKAGGGDGDDAVAVADLSSYYLIRGVTYSPPDDEDDEDELPTWAEIRVRVPLPEDTAALPKLLMMDIVEKALDASMLRSTRGIDNCYVVKERVGGVDRLAVQTSGCNFAAVWALQDYLDVDRVRCNHVIEVGRMYGVEAMRAAIVQEVNAVFGVYGISVNDRHLELIADYMTFTGQQRPMSHHGLLSGASVMQRMTFERSLDNLLESCLRGAHDRLLSPSASLMTGVPVKSGSGVFGVLADLNQQQQWTRGDFA